MVTLFSKIKIELDKITQWPRIQQFLSNIKMTNYTLFLKNSHTDDIPLRKPDLRTVTLVKMSVNILFRTKTK